MSVRRYLSLAAKLTVQEIMSTIRRTTELDLEVEVLLSFRDNEVRGSTTLMVMCRGAIWVE